VKNASGLQHVETLMAEMTKANIDTVLGRLAIEQGLATTEEVDECLKLSRDSGEINQRSLAELLVSKGVLTRGQVERLRPQAEEQKANQQIPGYQIIRRLGAGAMATVYLARQISLDRLVAVKVLPQKFSNNPDFVNRFYAEGKAAAKLNHPNIVGALDVGKAGEYHYFVMEYVQGRTVHDDIVAHKHFQEKEALDLIIQVASALEHAHQAGFIHRDVKPKNIMITEQGVAKLADMGLARAVSDREAAEAEQGKAFGTPYYISPEQIRGEVDVDFRADIYGLGATFYHMVTGQVPFDGPNPSTVMHKHLKADLIPADHINPKLSAGIAEIIDTCMAKDRMQRYNSTTDLIQDLKAVRAGEAPLQARKKFDLGALASLEKTGKPNVAQPAAATGPKAMTEHPMFWIAVSGWGLALLLLIVVIIMASIGGAD